MTERSSCKSFFKEYLIYRINAQKMNFILCCILNVFALPLFAASQKNGLNGSSSDFYYFGKYGSMISCIALMILAVIGAVFSFEFYTQKNLTDTTDSLPLSYKQRFWADLLAGYIANVAPIIPCGIVSVVISASTQSRLNELFAENELTSYFFSMTGYGIGIALTLFIVVTFTYLFAALVTSGCGKSFHSIIFSIFGIIALPFFAGGLAGCFANGIIGIDTMGYFDNALKFFPSVGLITEFFGSLNFFNNIDFTVLPYAEDMFAVFDLLHIVCYVILSAVVTAGAFYLGKHRKPEKTGSPFVIKPMFYVISSVLSAAAAVVMMISPIRYYVAQFWLIYLISAIAGAVMCLISELICLPKMKELPKSIACCIAAIAISIMLDVIFNLTGSFGLRYLSENADKIEYLNINNSYTITDKADIKRYMENHNDILKNNTDNLVFGDIYTIEYKTTNGKIITRGYTDLLRAGASVIDKMADNEKTLGKYGKYYFEELLNKDSYWECSIVEDNGSYDVPNDKITEFLEILREEAETKYDHEADIFARVNFSGGRYIRPFYIQTNYEKTIAFLNEISGGIKDPNEAMFHIIFDEFDQKYGRIGFLVSIRYKDAEKALVKEFIDLLEEKENYEVHDADNRFIIFSESVANTSYYVPQRNSKRVLEIITELALGDFE